jgi:DNA-directed RNA polymerase specialized sigma subunit
MINTRGIIQNNKTASDFIRTQRKYNKVYKILNKKEEREMIERYVRLVFDENGNPIYNEDFECEFEWIGDETELRLKLAMHNLQAVTQISTKHCQDTRDYDNMYAKGLYGLTRAANEFHPFKLITKTIGYKVNENGKKVPIREIKYDEHGNYGFIKFNTFAQFWIFKYVMDEFYEKSVAIDNNSISLNEIVKGFHENKSLTLENFVHDYISPDIAPVKTVTQEVSSNEMTDLYNSMHNYIKTSNELSTLEKNILEETFYGEYDYVRNDGSMNTKKLSSVLKIPQQTILTEQISALNKLKGYLKEEYGLESLSDIM